MAALAVGLHAAAVSGQIVFLVAAVAVAGLAWVLGIATEETGEVAGPRLSALLNATFGNPPSSSSSCSRSAPASSTSPRPRSSAPSSATCS